MMAFVVLAACARFPELDATRSPEVDTAPYPELISIDGLLKEPDPRGTPEDIEEIAARAEALRTRGQDSQADASDLAARAEALRRRQAEGIGAEPSQADRAAALRARAEALRAIE